MEKSNKIYDFIFTFLSLFWLMTLLPQLFQSEEQSSLEWTMIYALLAAVAFGYFNDVVIGLWYPELNEGAQVPWPRESVRRPIAFFLTVFVGFYFYCALNFLSSGDTGRTFAAGRLTLVSLAAAVVVLAIIYSMKWALCRKRGQGDA